MCKNIVTIAAGAGAVASISGHARRLSPLLGRVRELGANFDFIANHIVGHVVGMDNGQIQAALDGCPEEQCDVRTYGGAAPDWARFFSNVAHSPYGGFWWKFVLIGDSLPERSPEPAPGVTSPWWQLQR